jgi:hypothetical protein
LSACQNGATLQAVAPDWKAASVSTLRDVMKQMPAAATAIFPALGRNSSKYHGDVGFNAARRLSGGVLNVSHLATLRRL